ncbi:hypothetical protein FHS43_005848 [Streptosporangium becharense]|uniref:Uncharacterized protein n=1 Tax=Streptosporangium becharense TaxID=1816182 RepID=A0A7W9IMM3_9ACTN|nr:hypothetical protein [Streptosporangium becharense]MBB5823381.1 hypothetical protein [Streptosporangium becharense]
MRRETARTRAEQAERQARADTGRPLPVIGMGDCERRHPAVDRGYERASAENGAGDETTGIGPSPASGTGP